MLIARECDKETIWFYFSNARQSTESEPLS